MSATAIERPKRPTATAIWGMAIGTLGGLIGLGIQVVRGQLNKQIAGEMGITETTVKVHRSNMMRKIKAASLADLCRMVDMLGLAQSDPKNS